MKTADLNPHFEGDDAAGESRGGLVQDDDGLLDNPVLKEDDEYFGNYWKEQRGTWRAKIGLIKGERPAYDHPVFLEGGVITYETQHYKNELDEVERKLEELTGVPRFINSSGHKNLDRNTTEKRKKILSALQNHHKAWVAKTLDACNIRSPFSKLPVELRDIILNFAVEDIEYTWEYCGKDGRVLEHIIDVRGGPWSRLWFKGDETLIDELIMLAQLLYTRWMQLRELLVAKYEVNEETKKEWRLLKESGEHPYRKCAVRSTF